MPGFLRGVRASGRRYVPTRVEENAEIWTIPSNIGRVEKIIYKKSKVCVIFVGDKQNEYSYHHMSRGKSNEIQLNPLENIEFF